MPNGLRATHTHDRGRHSLCGGTDRPASPSPLTRIQRTGPPVCRLHCSGRLKRIPKTAVELYSQLIDQLRTGNRNVPFDLSTELKESLEVCVPTTYCDDR